MVLRIRLDTRCRLVRICAERRRTAAAVAALLTPAAVVAGAFGLWRIAADLRWANSFAIASGMFSHWQIWGGAALLLELCSHLLNRYGRGGDTAVS